MKARPYEVIIIGSGPAGSTAAYHLAKRGRRVLLLEKAKLPRTKVCGGGVSPQIAQWLDFDLSPAISAQVRRLRFTWRGGDPVEAAMDTREALWMVRRERFDQHLVDQAKVQGTVLMDQTEAKGLLFENGKWTVVTERGSLEGHYLLAADGALGKTAKWLGFTHRKHTLAVALEAEVSLLPAEPLTMHLDFGSLERGYIWNFPKGDGSSLGAGIFKGKEKQDLRMVLADFAQSLGIEAAELHSQAHPILLWDGDQALHTQQALLAGEAACLVDPFTAEGIRPSVLSGLRAAEALHSALADEDRALERYTHRIQEEWGSEMRWARRLAQIFFSAPALAYRVGVKHPGAAARMGQLLCGELRYSDIAQRAITRLTKGLFN